MLTEGNTLVTEKTILSILYGSRDTNHLLPLSTETITFEQVTNSHSLQIVSVFFTEKSSPNFRCWSFAIRVNKYRFEPPSILSSLFSSIWFFHWNLTNICLFTILKVFLCTSRENDIPQTNLDSLCSHRKHMREDRECCRCLLKTSVQLQNFYICLQPFSITDDVTLKIVRVNICMQVAISKSYPSIIILLRASGQNVWLKIGQNHLPCGTFSGVLWSFVLG